VIGSIISALFGGSAYAGDYAGDYTVFGSETLEAQTALIEFLSVAAAVLIAATLVFIIVREKKKNRGRN